MPRSEQEAPPEIALVGDLTDRQAELCEKLLEVPPGGPCILYFDSSGGSPYVAMALTSMIVLRGLDAIGVVVGECSSAALWPLAACGRRIVTPYSVFLFHRMKWQSEENIAPNEATEWARHFGTFEADMDRLLAELFDMPDDLLRQWTQPGCYVSGKELADAGLAELIPLERLDLLRPKKKSRKSRK